jgi:hypothetical protein
MTMLETQCSATTKRRPPVPLLLCFFRAEEGEGGLALLLSLPLSLDTAAAAAAAAAESQQHNQQKLQLCKMVKQAS